MRYFGIQRNDSDYKIKMSCVTLSYTLLCDADWGLLYGKRVSCSVCVLNLVKGIV